MLGLSGVAHIAMATHAPTTSLYRETERHISLTFLKNRIHFYDNDGSGNSNNFLLMYLQCTVHQREHIKFVFFEPCTK